MPADRCLLAHPLSLGDLPVLVDVRNVRQRLPDLLEQRLRDLVLGAVDLPATHVANLVLGPKKIVVSQTAVIVQICERKTK